MKALLKLEAIGNDRAEYQRLKRRGRASMHPVRERQYTTMDTSQPWVAEITGWTYDRRLIRSFLRPKRDYRDANGVGSRGVMFCYLLEDGHIYEVYERLTWNRSERYFARPDHGRLIRMEQWEVLQWLSVSEASASMS